MKKRYPNILSNGRYSRKRIFSGMVSSTIAILLACGGNESSSNDPGDRELQPSVTYTPVTDRGTSEERNPAFEERWEAFYPGEWNTGDTLVIGTIGDADSLNTLTSTSRGAADIIGLLFLSLTRTNPDFSHAPSLATSWEFSPDHLELAFHLRKDVFWQDGVQTTAHDVKFTYQKQIDPTIGWSAIKWKEHIQEVRVVDDFTVKFIFKRVYPYQLMDAAVGEILPQHLLKTVPSEEWKSHQFNRKPVGNGPFRFKEWRAQQHIVVEANPEYYRGRPPLDRIIFKVVPDQENLVLQLNSGQIDFMSGVPPRFMDNLLRQDQLVRHLYPGRAYTYLGWNLKSPLFHSKKVRQALSLAIDREDIVESVLFGIGEVCHSPILPILWAYNPNVSRFSFNLTKAKMLLAEEGWADSDGDGWLDQKGKVFEFELKTNKGNKDREDILVIVQDQLKQIGIRVKLNILEWTVLVNDMNHKNFEAVVLGWSVGLKVDMTTLWHSRSINDKFNFVSYSNAEFDDLNDQAIFEMDRDKAKKLWWSAQELISLDQPYTFLYIPKEINFIHHRFRNVQMETVGWQHNLEQWWVPQKDQKYR